MQPQTHVVIEPVDGTKEVQGAPLVPPQKGRPRKFKSELVAIRITKYTKQILNECRPGAPTGRIIREIVEKQAEYIASKLGRPLPR